MKNYHYIWLSTHRNRTEEWLRERLADGFDIHHADGDHSNDDPSNLVLIEATDHMRLHGGSLNRLLIKPERKYLTLGMEAYEMKNSEISWATIGAMINPTSVQPASYARLLAKTYADESGLPFPKPGSNMILPGRMEPYA